jgi:hypothetical protein
MLRSGGQLGEGVDNDEEEALKRLSAELGEGKGVYSYILVGRQDINPKVHVGTLPYI